MISCSWFDIVKYSAAEALSRVADFLGNGVLDPSSNFQLFFPSTPNMTTTISAGTARVNGYRIYFDGAPITTLTFAAADTVNPRIDLIQIGAFGSGINGYGAINIITGTPSSSPVQPTPSANCIGLYAVSIPANATSVNAMNITDLRKRATLFGIDIVKIFDGILGHKHTGVSGDGPQIGSSGLAAGAAVGNIGYTPLNKAGDTMTAGTITLYRDPIANMDAATKQYADANNVNTLSATGAVQIVSKVISIVSGGITAAMLAAGAAISNIGYTPAHSGANSDITSLTGLTTAIPISEGGTGQTTQQAASDAIHGAVTSGYYARGNGTHVVMSQLQAADITGQVAIANGGTGASTATGALNNLGAVYIVAESLGQNGYRKWSDGLIEQWGLIGPYNSETGQIVTFPISFTTALYEVGATIYLTGGLTASADQGTQIYSPSLGSVGIYLQEYGNGAFTWPVSAYWHAKGV